MSQRCMFGEDRLILKDAEPQLVERAFGCRKIIHGRAVTALDEPFVFKAVENYYIARDPYFKKEIRWQMRLSTSGPDQGSIKPVAPFFFPKSKPSVPDMVFIIRIDGTTVIPVFVQLKLHHKSSSFSENDWRDALSTVSAPKIENHSKDFRKYCPDNIYISMIVAYPTKWTSKLPEVPPTTMDTSGVQQVVINIGDNNFSKIFPEEHVEFIDRIKNVGKRSAEGDNDDDGDARTKKPRG
ncbi:hypothetical protein BG005_010533 [Podila minutissima]|nr:hypothetical protein BG005_010533 [Podila minutissima]